MTLLKTLLNNARLHKANQLSIADGISEIDDVEKILISMVDVLQEQQVHKGIACVSHWNPDYTTFTYHTHAVARNFKADSLEHLAKLFFNAYSLGKQEWYSQFVCGENHPLPKNIKHTIDSTDRHYQIGQGYFDFGVPSLRHYHTLFSLKQFDEASAVLVLRSIDHPFQALRKSKKVYLLPPTGDYFSLKQGDLHWHHICTVTGIGLLPGTMDRFLMNTLRHLGLDKQERKTYREEARCFVEFASRL